MKKNPLQHCCCKGSSLSIKSRTLICLLKNRILYKGHKSLLVFLWFHIEMICHMKNGIAWQGIDKCLGSTLGIYHTSDVVQVAQDVKAIKHPRQLSLEHGIGKAGIPEQIVGIHRTSFVTTAGIHGQVGTHLNMPGQIERGCSSIVEIYSIDVIEVHSLAVNISPGCRYLYAHGRRATYLIVQLQGFIQ